MNTKIKKSLNLLLRTLIVLATYGFLFYELFVNRKFSDLHFNMLNSNYSFYLLIFVFLLQIYSYSFVIFLFVTLILQNAISEFFFWNEFGVKYNFIAVDYLVYTNEVIGNIMQSYPVIPLFSTLFIVAGLVTYFIVKKSKNYIENALNTFNDSMPKATTKVIWLRTIPLKKNYNKIKISASCINILMRRILIIIHKLTLE